MKNSLTNPKNTAIFKRYAPLLQGGLMKIGMLLGIIILCSFTLFRFLHTQMSGLTEFIGEESVRNISLVVGGLLGAASITHFASMLPIVIRDIIQLWKERKEAEKKVHWGVLVINLLIIAAILGIDGYISTTGIRNAVSDMGEDLAASRFEDEKSTYQGSFSVSESKIMQAWRTDSANFEALYAGKISEVKSKMSGEIGALQGKAARGAAAGSTTWAASLRSAASGKSNQMEQKIAGFEAQKAADLLLRSQQRDKDLAAKDTEREANILGAKGKGDRIENRFKRYGGMTWVLSLALYIIYIGTCIKHELIHFGAGIENEVEVAERYFRPGFVQNLLHELGNWSHDIGRVITNFLSKKRISWSDKLRENAYLPLDAGDVYRQEANFSAAMVVAQAERQAAEHVQYVEEPYKQTGKIGFDVPQNEVATPPPVAQSLQEEILPDGRIKIKAFFKTVPPYEQIFEDRAAAEEWKRHIHPAVPMQEKTLMSTHLKRELEARTQPQTPPPPPVSPTITEISAPCENVITSSYLRVRKVPTVITKDETVITKKEPVITEEMLKHVSKEALSFTMSGIKKMESEIRSRAKKGEIRAGTYDKKMQRVNEGKRLITKTLGQTEIEFL